MLNKIKCFFGYHQYGPPEYLIPVNKPKEVAWLYGAYFATCKNCHHIMYITE